MLDKSWENRVITLDQQWSFGRHHFIVGHGQAQVHLLIEFYALLSMFTHFHPFDPFSSHFHPISSFGDEYCCKCLFNWNGNAGESHSSSDLRNKCAFAKESRHMARVCTLIGGKICPSWCSCICTVYKPTIT